MGEVDEEDGHDVRAHVAQCAECSGEERALRRALRRLTEAAGPLAPSAQRRADAVDAMARAFESGAARTALRRWQLAALATVAAGAVAIFATALLWLRAAPQGQLEVLAGEVRVQSLGGDEWVFLGRGGRAPLPARIVAGPAALARIAVRFSDGSRHELAFRPASQATLSVRDGALRVGLDGGELWGASEARAVVAGVAGDEVHVEQGEYAVHVAEFDRLPDEPDGADLRSVAETVARATNKHIGTGWLGRLRIRFEPERADAARLFEAFGEALEARGLALVPESPAGDRWRVVYARRASERSDRHLRIVVRLVSGRAEAACAGGRQRIEPGREWIPSGAGAGEVLAFSGDPAPWRSAAQEVPPARYVEAGDRLVRLVVRHDVRVEEQVIR
jgi:hypothetical protein